MTSRMCGVALVLAGVDGRPLVGINMARERMADGGFIKLCSPKTSILQNSNSQNINKAAE